jgi:hypothetical protein
MQVTNSWQTKSRGLCISTVQHNSWWLGRGLLDVLLPLVLLLAALLPLMCIT